MTFGKAKGRILNQDWLPNIEVVRLPPALRELDFRALLVRGRDADDFPSAVLAALLSPVCCSPSNKDFGAWASGAGTMAAMAYWP